MSGISGKIVLGVAAAVILLTLAIVFLTGGSPDVSSGDPSQRIAAIHEIAVNRPSDAGDTLAKAAASDPSAKVRREAMAGVSHFLKAGHIKVLRKSTKDSDPGVRAIVGDTLGAYAEKYPDKDKAVTADLIAMVAEDPVETVRQGALRGLARCDDPKSIVTLLDRAEHGAGRETKLVAMKALLRKLGVRLSRDRDPKDDRGWRDLIQRWKQSRRIQKAYAAAGERLVQRPQDILGKDWHPERRGRQ
ncbi:MAG: HEAT repeat domain-containing protein [Phycisphaerae bacterium]|jgi:hypothetical protein|nr:HEAT repeat domain-containing protein [Phycisphaerae bacterium]